jgi:hemerythrin-like metal-binding protein
LLQEINLDHLVLNDTLRSLLQCRRESDTDRLNAEIDMLMNYTLEHSMREEQFMASVRYPHLDRHRTAHEELRENFLWDLRLAVKGELTHTEFINRVHVMFEKPFRNEDSLFSEWLNNSGV